MQTSMRIDQRNRDELARIAAVDLGGVTLDEALRVVLFEHRTRSALARLAADPDSVGGYVDEARDLAEVDPEVHG